MQEKNHDMADVQDEVIPFYFGTSPQRLYGCHHLPQGSGGKPFAIVICSAIGQEYLRSHRVIYQLAVLLSKAGYHVLRFDYYGCGDSDGDLEQGSIVQWTKDIHAAIDEIRKVSGQPRMHLIGFRLGAALAMQAAVDCHYLGGIVLWEPVITGKHYLKELEEYHREFLHAWRHKIKLTVGMGGGAYEEILGFPMTSELRRELEAIDVNHMDLRPGLRVLAVFNSEESGRVTDLDCIKRIHPHAELHSVHDQPKVWREFYRRLTPHKTIQYIVKWIDSLNT